MVLSSLALALALGAPPPLKGPYLTAHKMFKVPALDETDPQAVIVYPTTTMDNNNSALPSSFPLLSYAHGAAGGGWYTFEGYYALWTQIASHGFVVVATKSCSLGCKNGGWKTYFLEQLKCFDWANNETQAGTDPEIFGKIDWSKGTGIVGHSMGGQATVRSAAKEYVDKYNIKAAVLHHPETDDGGSEMVVPVAAFTGTTDHTCPPSQAHHIWDPATVRPKTFANRVGANHLEPVLIPPIEHPELGMYTAAWFKIFLEDDKEEYHSLIYNKDDPNMLCNLVNMSECINDL